MKVTIGTTYRISVNKRCGCRATQEFTDEAMKSADGEPTFKPCEKHVKGAAGEVIGEIMLETIADAVEESRSKATLAIAQANRVRIEGPVEEAATSTEAPAPAERAAARQSVVTVGNRPVNRPKARTGSGVRLSATATSTAGPSAAKTAAVRPPATSIDAELAGVDMATQTAENTNITKHLVDAPGGLLGDDEDDTSEV